MQNVEKFEQVRHVEFDSECYGYVWRQTHSLPMWISQIWIENHTSQCNSYYVDQIEFIWYIITKSQSELSIQ